MAFGPTFKPGTSYTKPYTIPSTTDVIDYEVEQQFSSYLKKKSFEETGVALIPTANALGQTTLTAAVNQQPANFKDVINFIADFQTKQEMEFLANHDISELNTFTNTDYEDVIAKQYSKDYYSLDQSLDLLLKSNGLA